MSYLIIDVDKSLSSIGGETGASQISGVPPVPINGGVTQITKILNKLFQEKVKVIEHPLFGKTQELVIEAQPFVKEHNLEGIVIDTFSVAMKQEIRNITGIDKATGRPKLMEMKDWGLLGRVGEDFLLMLQKLPIWVVINCHIDYDKDGTTGGFYWVPAVQGGTKMEMMKYFDVIGFTHIQRVSKEKVEYLWQVRPDGQKFAKDRKGILASEIPQNFRLILDGYKAQGDPFPKILIIGESGTGKTSAIKTLTPIKTPNEN